MVMVMLPIYICGFHEIFLKWLKLDTSNFVLWFAIWHISIEMINRLSCGHDQATCCLYFLAWVVSSSDLVLDWRSLLLFEIRVISTTREIGVNPKAHIACDFNFIVKSEGLLKVTRCHIHWKSSILEQCEIRMFLQQVTSRKWYATYVIAAIAITLDVFEGHSPSTAFATYFI